MDNFEKLMVLSVLPSSDMSSSGEERPERAKPTMSLFEFSKWLGEFFRIRRIGR